MCSKYRTEQRKAYERIWRKKKRDAMIAKKYGPEFISQRMNGRHGNHAKGENHARWAQRIITTEGYVAIRVPMNHPHAWGPPTLKNFRYAYEHIVMMIGMLGRPLEPNEVVHHKNGNKTDNRYENLELKTRSDHARDHSNDIARDMFGKFRAGIPDLRVREFPKAVI